MTFLLFESLIFSNALSSCFQVVCKYPSRITSNYQFKQTWFILCVLQCTDMLVVFLVMNHQCMVMNHLKLTTRVSAQTPNVWSFQITSHTFSLLLVVTDVHG
jgi:hypothetical protein